MKTRKAAVVKVMPGKAEHDEESLAPLFREVLSRLGENPDRDGLARTPERKRWVRVLILIVDV